MKTNLSADDLMLGAVDLYKKILFSNKNDIFYSALEAKLNDVALRDETNTDRLKEINYFGIASIKRYGKQLEDEIDKLRN